MVADQNRGEFTLLNEIKVRKSYKEMSASKKVSLSARIILSSMVLFMVLIEHGYVENDLEERLCGAALRGDIAAVERLVNLGVDVDGKSLKWHTTPLKAAEANGHVGIVWFLLKHHAQTTETLPGQKNSPDPFVAGSNNLTDPDNFDCRFARERTSA